MLTTEIIFSVLTSVQSSVDMSILNTVVTFQFLFLLQVFSNKCSNVP